MDPILGMIVLWPVPWVPQGWALCDGAVLLVASNQALFSLIGNRYGGDGVKTFALPNLKSRFPLGSASALDFPTVGGSSSCPVASTGSVSLKVNNLPAHQHDATFSGVQPSPATTSVEVAVPTVAATPATVSAPGNLLTLATTAGPASKIYSSAVADSSLRSFTASGTTNIPAPSGNVSVAPAGSGAAVNVSVAGTAQTMPPYLTMNYIIAVEGIYPSRS